MRFLLPLLLLVGCGAQRSVQLVDTVLKGPAVTELGDVYSRAPNIIVGVVTENTVVRKDIPAAHYPDARLDLHLVRCHIENQLRGHLDSDDINFYYFADEAYLFFKRSFEASLGKRYIFFLTEEQGDSTLKYHSQIRHSHQIPQLNLPPFQPHPTSPRTKPAHPPLTT